MYNHEEAPTWRLLRIRFSILVLLVSGTVICLGPAVMDFAISFSCTAPGIFPSLIIPPEFRGHHAFSAIPAVDVSVVTGRSRAYRGRASCSLWPSAANLNLEKAALVLPSGSSLTSDHRPATKMPLDLILVLSFLGDPFGDPFISRSNKPRGPGFCKLFGFGISDASAKLHG